MTAAPGFRPLPQPRRGDRTPWHRVCSKPVSIVASLRACKTESRKFGHASLRENNDEFHAAADRHSPRCLPPCRVYWRRWLVPALAIAALAGLYATFMPETWEASQALIVRNEAANSQASPGKFSHVEDMKTVQDTILELVKGRGVLAAAAAKVTGSEPRPAEVEALADAVKLSPPKGTEFGKTEIFYLKVRDHQAPRAVALSDAICAELQVRFQDLRDAKAQSMIAELAKAR